MEKGRENMETKKFYVRNILLGLAFFGFILSPVLATTSQARTKTTREIQAESNRALNVFVHQVQGGRELLKSAKGVLIIPNVVKAGLGVGGEYGEGELRVGGKTVAYYNIAGGSFGLEAGAEKKDLILIFNQEEALQKFRAKSDWTAGMDGGVTVIDKGKQKYIDNFTVREPIVAFVFGEKGLMLDASIEGTKFSKLNKTV